LRLISLLVDEIALLLGETALPLCEFTLLLDEMPLLHREDRRHRCYHHQDQK
jgi:hypothetical protein